jgi:hypothetical protein
MKASVHRFHACAIRPDNATLSQFAGARSCIVREDQTLEVLMDFSLSSSLFAGEQQFKTFQPEKI